MLFFFHRRALDFRLDFLIKKGKVGVWFIIIFDEKVYFTLSQDNFILVDVIQVSMWDMSFVFKNA